MARQEKLTNGPAAAAVLSAGVGSLVLGLLTTLPQASSSVKNALNFFDPASPLSGKTTLAILVWLVLWAILQPLWRDSSVNFDKIYFVSLVLIGLGLIGTFPPFFELFGH